MEYKKLVKKLEQILEVLRPSLHPKHTLPELLDQVYVEVRALVAPEPEDGSEWEDNDKVSERASEVPDQQGEMT